MRVYDYSDFIALRLYDSLSTVACPPSLNHPPLTSIWPWPRNLISRKSYLSLFEGHFFFSGSSDRLRNQSERSLDMMSHKSQKPLFSLFFLQFTFSPSTRKKNSEIRNKREIRSPDRTIRKKRAMSHTHSDPCQNIESVTGRRGKKLNPVKTIKKNKKEIVITKKT